MTIRKHSPIATAATFAGFVTAGAPALATQSISCAGIETPAAVDLLLGAGPVPNILSVGVAVGERVLTTNADQPGEKVTIAQSYDDGEVVRVDLVDDQATRQVAAIRIIRADDKTGPFQIGYVQVDDGVAVGITCEGP